jgi:hypothetical protein
MHPQGCRLGAGLAYSHSLATLLRPAQQPAPAPCNKFLGTLSLARDSQQCTL